MNKRTRPTPPDCTNCVEYIYGVGCIAMECPCLAERFAAGVVGYREAAANTFSYNGKLLHRLTTLIGDFPGTMWRNEAHRQRYLHAVSRCPNRAAALCAAVYLLTADRELCGRAAPALTRNGVRFAKIPAVGMTGEEYTLYSYAKKLYLGGPIPLGELIDERLISDDLFRITVNAMMIARHGPAVLKISRVLSEKEVFDYAGLSGEQGT